MKSNLEVIVLKTAEDRSSRHTNYKYLIKHNGISSYSAYQTDKGFETFLKRNKMKMKQNFSFGLNRSFVLNKTIEERLFWKVSDIENIDDCVSYTGLSNGSLVTCYSEVLENKVINYRPNSNAKNVYNPLPIKSHIEFQRIYG